jgi:hypothetical protein
MMNRWHPRGQYNAGEGTPMRMRTKRMGWPMWCAQTFANPHRPGPHTVVPPGADPTCSRHPLAASMASHCLLSTSQVRTGRGASDGAGARLDMLLRHCLRCHSF